MLACLLEPSHGDALVMGHSIKSDPSGVKRSIGVVPQEIALYPDLSARENLNFWGKMYGLRGELLRQQVDRVLDIIGLVDRQKQRAGTFSGGMKRRLNIGIALLYKPQVIIMDEPTVGIDPQSRRHILDNVKFAAMGGAWFPLEVTGKTFATIGHIMPTAWAMDGFQNLILRGLGFSSMLPPAGILAAYSALFFVLAVWRFSFE